ncbi:MAG: DNA polymerase III subunit delta' [Desulfomonile tiedjei]|nr:DNA polymerase III subunit delta' [Desulfomonile tiedjei]
MTPIVGHRKLLALLEQTVINGVPAHAYLFTGPEGIGKQLVAGQFARWLNCPDLGHDERTECSSCRRIQQGNHPDVILEKPDKGRIRIDRIRAIQSFFVYAPVEGRFRVCVIDDAHTMNRPAQNALLKTLEEPPAGRILILITSTPSLLLPTVRSRCRRIRFGALPAAVLATLLHEKGIPAERAAVLAAMSAGSVSRAVQMNALDFFELREKMISALTDPGARGISGLLELSGDLSKDRHSATDSLEMALTLLRDLMLTAVTPHASGVVHGDFLDRMNAAAQHLSADTILSLYDEVVRASELIQSEINVNRNLVMDVLLLRISRTVGGPTLGIGASAR